MIGTMTSNISKSLSSSLDTNVDKSKKEENLAALDDVDNI